MPRRIVPLLLLICAIPGASQLVRAEELICPTLLVSGELDPGLTDVERRLACGDPEGAGTGNPWRTVPLSQARYHLRIFLQQRGYHHPKITESEGRNILEPGEPTRVSEAVALDAPPFFDLSRKRGVAGERLTPKLLDELENWSVSELQRLGYPCPRVVARANAETGRIELQVEEGRAAVFGPVSEESIPGLRDGTLRRYDAFREGGPFNDLWLKVTAHRILLDDVVQSAHFAPLCEEFERSGLPAVRIRQETVAGAPRLLAIGFGLNTEGLLLLRTSWRNGRLGPGASSYQAVALGSAREQSLSLETQWYFRDRPSRLRFRPVLELRHENEEFFEQLALLARLTPATSWDGDWIGLQGGLGPSLNFYRTLRGAGVGMSRFLSLDGDLRLQTHDFEYFAASPRSGYRFTLRANGTRDGFLSEVSAARGLLGWELLWNLRERDPPLWVLGIRGAAASTLTPERTGAGTRLPLDYIHFLGGSADLRGWGRRELPDANGALSAVFSDVELRLVGQLPLGFEPFAFLDLGAAGREPASLDSPVYRSPGLGLRWSSPIGVFRASVAHGFPETETTPSHFQFYLSYGEEF